MPPSVLAVSASSQCLILLGQITINDNFAKLSEALFIADRHAREEVKIRAEMQSKLAAKEKREKEEKLRMLAQRAREERAGLVSGGGGGGAREPPSERSEESSESEDSIDEDERSKLKEREELRRERQKQREREFRMSHMGAETKARVLSKRLEFGTERGFSNARLIMIYL